MQTTLRSPVTFKGQGLHSGRPAILTLHPAPANHGVQFLRRDVALGIGAVPARFDAVNQSPLCTRLQNTHGVSVSTVEHLMAALAGCGVHNVRAELDGPEIPILDGSAAPFVRGIFKAGIKPLNAELRAIRVLRPVSVARGEATAALAPHDRMHIDFHIDFDDAAIGTQERSLSLANGAFARVLSDSRTFCRQAEVEAMREQGLALGGTYENAVVVDGDKVLSPGGLRHDDEAVRHKMLDALGDLALAGLPILGRYTGYRAGHALTNDLLRALFADPANFEIVTCDVETASRLPGSGLHLSDIPQVA
ncbi:UDP-3-O-acyl-N-acetylglucosamine deacetylase [Poseidonocella sedimentorum]|uniref:UDP-3-O-acyl-N-acetylglucosamine deacetylase n=1 Tax=Poseidonocella sedimentorum TaxID=871652 RepID=A0A1I6CP40_9RHOB|nr:UDP-3-O-acyl-N-acetylglucosamine deacetylase [Poseidonocella sedimentorum]SFQ94924.1 UDP-3-O-[3-hydroxymyristoyl] N-acetylglucosamine deacetylase [Poseidonocella sedimentorum]